MKRGLFDFSFDWLGVYSRRGLINRGFWLERFLGKKKKKKKFSGLLVILYVFLWFITFISLPRKFNSCFIADNFEIFISMKNLLVLREVIFAKIISITLLKDYEGIFVELNFQKKKILLCCTYNPHKNIISNHLWICKWNYIISFPYCREFQFWNG